MHGRPSKRGRVYFLGGKDQPSPGLCTSQFRSARGKELPLQRRRRENLREESAASLSSMKGGEDQGLRPKASAPGIKRKEGQRTFRDSSES